MLTNKIICVKINTNVIEGRKIVKNYEKFYEEVEDMSVSVSVLVNVLSLYYDTLLYSQNGGNLGKSDKFCDWLYIINRYAEEVKEEIEEMLKRNMREKIN